VTGRWKIVGRNFFGCIKEITLKMRNVIKTEGSIAGAMRIYRSAYKRIYMKYYFSVFVNLRRNELEKQKLESNQGTILFSVIVPVYNTPEKFFREMVDSCINQTYGNWELCIADGSDASYHKIEKIAQEFMSRDARLKYRRLESNRGISENTNAALLMAEGNYIVLLDHDDMLHPSALYENYKNIMQNSADFLYSNELVFRDRVSNVVALHIKPDFSFDTLRGNNYICHLCVFSADLLKKAGMFQREYDGSQDHDMIFRLCENADRIVHIPKILYFWRMHSNSVTNDILNKPYAIEAGRNAVQRHLQRVGLDGKVNNIEGTPTFYLIDYTKDIKSKIGIYVLYEDEKNIKAFVQSVIDYTLYRNYDITVCCTEKQRDVVDGILSEFNIKSNDKKCCSFLYGGQEDIYINAVQQGNADFILLCDSRLRILTGDWLENMLMYAERNEIDLVAPEIVDERDRVIHTGGDILEYRPDYFGYFKCLEIEDEEKQYMLLYDYREWRKKHGYMGRILYAHHVTVISGLCVMMKRSKYQRNKIIFYTKGKGQYCLMRSKKNSSLWTPQSLLRYDGKF